MKKLIFLFYTMFLFLLPAYSQFDTAILNKQQHHQKMVIAQGSINGLLSVKEVRELTREQAKLERMERRAKADGIVTVREKRKLRKATRRSARYIRRENRDRNRY